jgi:predicted ABC-type ATPase
MSAEKKIVIIAGPNGAGKTTFAQAWLPYEPNCRLFINADLIAAGLSPFDPDAAALRAGRLMLEEIDRNAAAGQSFGFETTLAGHTYLRRVRSWRSAGFVVKVLFLSLPSPEEAIERVAFRLQQGGHDIPPDVIRRRFLVGMKNFMDVYRFEVDHWQLFDNSGPSPVLLSEGGWS